MLGRLRLAAQRTFGKLYHSAFRFRELYENRFEAMVAVVEIGLIGTGLVLAWYQHREKPEGLSFWETPLQGAESIVFLLLLTLSLSRVLVAWRRTRLGYSYGKLVKLLGGEQSGSVQRVFQQISGIGWGFAPGLQPGFADRMRRVASIIAHQTAGLLSVRSWFLRDERWRSREAESLGEWFREFPACLWKLPAIDGQSASERFHPSGYFSIIVPMTPQSARSIRQGQRATDLAEVDPRAIRAFDPARGGSAECLDRLELLAYLHIYVPRASRRDQDEARLLAASVQHLAFLLRGFWGSQPACEERWNFTLLCESSNRGMNRVLASLGFEAVQREKDGAPGEAWEARSYAGFLLFELRVKAGRGETAGANEFLAALRRLINTYPDPHPAAVTQAPVDAPVDAPGATSAALPGTPAG